MTENKHCWACGRFVRTLGDNVDFSYYYCVCDVGEIWSPKIGYTPTQAYTDPEYMTRMGYIDHGARHCPSPA